MFLAVELDEPARRQAAGLIEQLAQLRDKVKWVEPGNLHWTVQFLGDVPADQADAIAEHGQRALADLPPFELELRGLGAFPSARRPQTIWLGAGAGAEGMAELFRRVSRALRPLGFKPETRRFSPHVTLGRLRDRASPALVQALGEHADDAVATMTAAWLTLFASTLLPAGPVYRVLHHMSLAAG